ncbi:hypothetical protein CEE44_01965 [Candidatus Woesearchaeota archaeon B3_Woes]|nr:MAG: hypothetical protein CEE44_01965 [Candidatus Woesearchaeota archaeon B3_Woes]
MVEDNFIQEEYTPVKDSFDESANFNYEEKIEEKKFVDETPKTEIKKENIQSKLPVSEDAPKAVETKKPKAKPIKKKEISRPKKTKEISDEKKPRINKKKIKTNLTAFKKYIQFPKNKKKKSKAKLKNTATIGAIIAIIVIVVLILNINNIFPDQGTPVAIVNNEIITDIDLETTAKTLPPEFQLSLTDEGLLNQTVMNVVLLQEAKKQGLETTNDEVQETINQIMLTNQITQKEFKENLKQQGLTMKDMEKFYKEYISIGKLVQTNVFSNITITPEEVREFYDNSDLNATFEESEQEIVNFIAQQKQVKALNNYIAELMDKSDIRILNKEEITTQSFSSEEVEKYSTCAVENGLKKDAIVFVYSESCPHCLRMKPIVTDLEVEEYNFKWISASDNEAKTILRNCFSDVLAGGVPQFICAKNGQTIVGETPKETLRAFAQSCQ